MNSDDLESRIRSLLAEQRKIEAIKVYREATGTGLKEAKEAVEALESGGTLPGRRASDPELEQQVLEMLNRGEKIPAIKLYRERTGSGLAEAKRAVETLARAHNIPVGSGCAGMVLLLVSGLLLPLLVLRAQVSPPPRAEGRVSDARLDANGILVHSVESEYQQGVTQIQVLLPARQRDGQRRRVLYVLPVEASTGDRYGNGLLEVKKLGLHDQHDLLCVQPIFSHLPWYADHPNDKARRQESYFLRVILPYIEGRYPVRAEPEGRLLVGFSKSGWGAFSLLLRHPEVFGRAAAWDAPLNMTAPNRFGMGDIFGTQENFEAYRIGSLLDRRASTLGADKRLALVGYANFREHHQALHEKLSLLKVPHEYRDEAKPRHTWDAGWLAEAVGILAGAR